MFSYSNKMTKVKAIIESRNALLLNLGKKCFPHFCVFYLLAHLKSEHLAEFLLFLNFWKYDTHYSNNHETKYATLHVYFCTHFFYNSQCKKLNIHYKQSNRKKINFLYFVLVRQSLAIEPRIYNNSPTSVPLLLRLQAYIPCSVLYKNIYTCVYFWNMVSLYNSSWPRTPYRDQAGLQFLDLTVSDSKFRLKVCTKGARKI